MRSFAVAVAVVAALAGAPVAAAHPIGSTGVALDVREHDAVADLQIPLDELGTALGRGLPPAAAQGDRVALERYVGSHISAAGDDGAPWSVRVGRSRVARPGGVPSLVLRVTLTPPGGTVGPFTLHYGAVVDDLDTHRAFVTLARASGKPRTLDIVTFRHKDVSVPAPGKAPSRSRAFGAMVRQGVEHIGDGTDHLLFLITLLLPAPLVASRRRWTVAPSARRAFVRIVHVVTAFALGHSLTLAAAGSGLVDVPRRPVEVLIAVSIAVSALHAIRPLVPGGEAAIAFGFGLVHGLGFAEVLRELGLAGRELVVSLLGFNLGIELAQLLVVVLLMPSLWVLSRTRVYPALRITVSALAFLAAVAWALQRSGVVSRSPFDAALASVAARPLLAAAVLACAAAAAYAGERRLAAD